VYILENECYRRHLRREQGGHRAKHFRSGTAAIEQLLERWSEVWEHVEKRSERRRDRERITYTRCDVDAGQRGDKPAHQAGLADSGLAADQHHPAAPVSDVGHSLIQQA
jgi:hypothetical protein